jgi:cytochrome c-type biogenesis protein CcmH/NrfG
VDAAAATLRRAIARDAGNFELWLDLARALDGPARDQALARASRLDPRSPEIAQFRSELALEEPVATSEVPST